MQNSTLQREWRRVCREEAKYLRENSKVSESRLNRMLEDKIPDNLQDTLDAAFCKAFELIFQKGTGIIEKTYDRDEIEKEFRRALDGEDTSAHTTNNLRAVSNRAEDSGGRSFLLSGIEGVGLGLLGIGLPDIPIFTGVLLRSVYKIALSYGYDYESRKEKYFVLAVIEAALSHGENLKATNDDLNRFIVDGKYPPHYSQVRQIRKTSATLSQELLYMKFLQGVPVVGAVGGAYDAIYMKRVQKFANIKYKRRFLADQHREEDERNASEESDQGGPDDGPSIA